METVNADNVATMSTQNNNGFAAHGDKFEAR